MQNRTKPDRDLLRICLTGAFSVTGADDQNIALAGRKDRAVLGFLAAHAGRSIARERLVDLLWPDAADGAGRASLRQSISTIRKAMGDQDALIVERDTVTLDAAKITTDVDELDTSPDSPASLTTLPLTNGEGFLDDLGGLSSDFDHWRATEQARIEARVSDKIEHLATRSENDGNKTAAIAALSQLVSLNPLNEAAQRRYLKALISDGQGNTAIRHYRELEKRLQSDLGVRPERATQDLYDEARKKAGPVRAQDAPKPADQQERRRGALWIIPFSDLSNDEDARNFSEGLSYSIASALAQISGLEVFSGPPPSSGVDASDEARNDREGHCLHGIVRRTGTRVRVSVRLVGASSGRLYWAEDYDRGFDDVLTVQDQITQQIAVELRIKLSEGEKIRVLANYTKDLEVWSRLMRADVLINTLVEEDNIRARKLLEEAVEIDPDCAAAWAELGDSYIGDCMMGRRTLSLEDYTSRAMHAAEMALRAEPDFTHALNIKSFVEFFRGQCEEAVKTTRAALAAAPRNPEITANCAYIFLFCGYVNDAHRIIQRAIDASPIPPMWYSMVKGACLYCEDKFAEAIPVLEAAVRQVPESALARPYLVGAVVETGQFGAAKRVVEDIGQVQPDFNLETWPGADFADPKLKQRLINSLKVGGIYA